MLYRIISHHTYTYHYDKRGNLKYKVNKKTKEEKHYGFNVLNQLEEFLVLDSHGNQVKKLTYTYDGFNRRISKNEDDVLHYYLYNKENIIAILDEDKNELATIVHHPTRTDTPLSINNYLNQETYYYHRAPQGHFRRLCSGHHQGSIVALTNEEGQTVESIVYDGHYGTVLNHHKTIDTLNPYGYTGREMDTPELYYYRARYCDPTMQRFLSFDPIKLRSGDFNFYRYVGGDPVNRVDPSGLESCECQIMKHKSPKELVADGKKRREELSKERLANASDWMNNNGYKPGNEERLKYLWGGLAIPFAAPLVLEVATLAETAIVCSPVETAVAIGIADGAFMGGTAPSNAGEVFGTILNRIGITPSVK